VLDLFLLCSGAFLAGTVDAIVGGGGLIQVPLLFTTLPWAPPATLFGTNKVSSVLGTTFAAWAYSRKVAVPWALVAPAAATAMIGSYCGAAAVGLLPKDLLRPLILVLLMGATGYTFANKDLGLLSQDANRHGVGFWAAVSVGGAMGFYDGFFGPGAGSLLVFLFVRFFSLDFLRASAAAKVVNAATNIAALGYFIPAGSVLWRYGLAMACFNVAGAWYGSHLALRKGSGFVRHVFLGVSLSLIAKFAYDTFK
jgi:uncharacterized membrane protein YfcA